MSSVALWIGLLSVTSLPTKADVLAENIAAGAVKFGNLSLPGQSFTVVGSGSYSNITFNFFTDVNGQSPYAIGTGFLLSTAHVGSGGINSATTGYLGSAIASGGIYNFGSSVTLVSGTQYFFYSLFEYAPGGTLLLNSNSYSGGAFIYASDDGQGFSASAADTHFRVTGDPLIASVPDTGTTAAMLGLALAGLVAVRRRLMS